MEQFPIHERSPRHAREHALETDIEARIQTSIDKARESRRDIAFPAARLIGQVIAHSPDSPLGIWARRGDGINTTLRDEYLRVFHDPDTPTEVKEWIDWLGEHLVHADNPIPKRHDRFAGTPRLQGILWHVNLRDHGGPSSAYVAADTPPEALDALANRLVQFVDEHGEAFELFLAMNDVDASSPDPLESFTESYVGEFESIEQVLAVVTDADDIYAAISHLAEKVHRRRTHPTRRRRTMGPRPRSLARHRTRRKVLGLRTLMHDPNQPNFKR